MADKQLERFLLERFIASAGFLEVCGISEAERPDFLIEIGDSEVGVEITRYFIQPETGSRPLQEQENLRSLVLNRASEKFSSIDTRLVQVNVLFHHSRSLHKQDVEDLAERLSLIVSRMDVSSGSFETIESSWNSEVKLPDSILSVTVTRSDNFTKSYWLFDDVGVVPTCEAYEIQNILDSKEVNVSEYRKRCSKVWLLIAVDGFGLSSYADFPLSLYESEYVSSFDRIFIFINQQSRVLELTIL